MLKSWRMLEHIVEKSHLRLLIYALFFLVGISLFFTRNVYLVLSFVIILGCYAVFEGLNPTVWREVIDLKPKFVPTKAAIAMVILIRVCLIVLGLFLIFLMGKGLSDFLTGEL